MGLVSSLWAAACAAPPSGTKGCGPASYFCTPDPAEKGPYRVGVATLALSRQGPDGGVRPLVTEVWYPAVVAEDDVADSYRAESVLTEAARTKLTIPEGAPTLEQDAVRDAPFLLQGPYPLLVFSHGNAGVRFQSFSFATHLASHGYVVAAPDHVGDTLSDLVLTGKFDAAVLLGAAMERPGDVIAVARRLEEGVGPLPRGAVRTDGYGVFGHSFGGATSFAAASPGGFGYDPKIKAVAGISPETVVMGAMGDGPKDVALPKLLLCGMVDQTLGYPEHCQRAYNLAKTPRFLVGVRGAGHFSFTEACQLDLPAIAAAIKIKGSDRLLQIVQDGCGPSFRSPAEVVGISSRFLTAFFNRHLRDSLRSEFYLLPEGEVPEEVKEATEMVADP